MTNNNLQKGFATPIIIAIIALIVVVAGVGYFSTRSEPQQTSITQTPTGEKTSKDGMVVNADGTMARDDGTTMKAGSYEAYSPEKIAEAAAKGDVVLFFRALWCPSCRDLDADINANLINIPENLTILIVDYDNSTDLKKKYGVTFQHTLVQVDGDGTLIKKWSKSLTLVAFISDMQK